MTGVSTWIAGVLVAAGAVLCGAAGQTRAGSTSPAQAVLPSGLGDAVDRDSRGVVTA